MGSAIERLASWSEVGPRLAATFPGTRVREDGPIEVDVQLPDRSTQTVVVNTLEVDGVAWLDVRAVVGPARYVGPAKALEENAFSSVGALGVDGNVLVLRQMLVLEGVRLRDLAETIGVLALRCLQRRKAVS